MVRPIDPEIMNHESISTLMRRFYRIIVITDRGKNLSKELSSKVPFNNVSNKKWFTNQSRNMLSFKRCKNQIVPLR
jgi:hypothetical protein